MITDEIVKGYKATDKNMKCRGFQFELGTWHKHDGKIAMCESGFHFCEYPSGPWSFYSDEGTRIFEVEARGVIKGDEPGADNKHVAMEIRLVKEITTGGRGNTGHWNTGHWNTGERNTGHWNTGHWNTGERNTGERNTGRGNTGHGNTGHWNTGHGNATDKCSGHLCIKEQPTVIFDKKVQDGTYIDWKLVKELSELMRKDDHIKNIKKFLDIPNASEKKIIALHNAHINRRRTK